MQSDKMNDLEHIKASRWPRNQATFLLIIIAFIVGCGYLINAVMELLQTI